MRVPACLGIAPRYRDVKNAQVLFGDHLAGHARSSVGSDGGGGDKESRNSAVVGTRPICI